MADAAPAIAPVAPRARIDVLDVLRGLAIVGIFFLNLPFMLGPTNAALADPRAFGWAPADRATWLFLTTFVEGTQRGMLEFLFGAALLLITGKALVPDGRGQGAANLWARRNLWLLAFGMIDVFVLLWPGDILNVYAVAALFLLPFRRLPVRALLGIGLAIPVALSVSGVEQYVSRVQLVDAVAIAREGGGPHSAPARAALAEWDAVTHKAHTLPADYRAAIAQEAQARSGTFAQFAAFQHASWIDGILGTGLTALWVLEAFSAMLIGMALFRLGVLQGALSPRGYLAIAALAYGFGLTLRYLGALELIGPPELPQTRWFTAEFTRLSVSLGHVALVNLVMKAASGRMLLVPFRAAGRTAFSLYFAQQVIGLWVMASPAGLHWPRAIGWAQSTLVAAAVGAALLVAANLWLRFFASGPLEWLWRTITYLRPMPLLRER